MSFHFLNGNTYGAYADTGPGTIIVDPLADIHATGMPTALTLGTGPWTVTVKGTVRSDGGDAIYLEDAGAFVSTVTIGKGAKIDAPSLFRVGIYANHAANVTNAGQITAQLAAIAETGDGNFRIENAKSGAITGNQFGIDVESLGTHTIVNAGTIEAELAIKSASGIEKVTNSGKLIGDIDLGGGNDVFSNFATAGHTTKHGSVAGTIDLGAGNDRFNGGSKSETVKDGDGKDTIKLGGGNDVWKGYLDGGNDLVDTIDGGKGIDTYDASGASSDIIVVVLGTDFTFFPGNAAFSFLGGLEFAETISGFENAIGSDGEDGLFGSAGANALSGGDGEDYLAGRGGADQLYGGGDADIFYFTSLKDSGPTKATRDTIHDFEVGVDHISLVDLNDKLGGIIAGFLGIDVEFGGNKGDLRAVISGENTIVELDVNGDRRADFSIRLDGHHALAEDDFLF